MKVTVRVTVTVRVRARVRVRVRVKVGVGVGVRVKVRRVTCGFRGSGQIDTVSLRVDKYGLRVGSRPSCLLGLGQVV